MRKILLALGLAAATHLVAGETLNLQLVPDREVVLRGAPQEVVVKIDLSAVAERKKSRHTPLNLAVVLDKSGSMAGLKLEKAKQAAMQVVDRLEEKDFFSLIIYSDRAEVLIPAGHVKDKDALKERIESIRADGSTALFAGVRLGADQLQEYFSSKRINRVILLSDGLANVGPSSTRELRRLGSQLAEGGMAVTTIGVGDDYNEDLMAGLAEASDANYYYVKDTEKLPAIFAKELGEMLTVAARDVRIEITCPPGVMPLGFVGRPERFDEQHGVVKLSQFTLGQNRYLLLRCRVQEEQPEVARVRISYKDELADGGERSVTGVARVSYTGNQAEADRSVNNTVVAQKLLMLTAVAKDEAMSQADGGKFKDAAATLARQKKQLDAVYAAAPAAVQVQIRAETANLHDFSDQLNEGNYNAESRKVMQSQSFNARNSK